MIKLNQPGFKNFLTYVISFILLTLFIYLVIPFFFDYKNNISYLEKKILNSFGLNLNINSHVKYNMFPSPRLNLQNVEILGFPAGSNNIGKAEKIILNIPFKKLSNLNSLEFDSVKLVNANLNIEASEIKSLRKFLNKTSNQKPIKIKKSKINLVNKSKLLLSVDLKKIDILSSILFDNINLNGKIFDTKIKVGYKNKKYSSTPTKHITVHFPEIGLNIKSNINNDEKNKENYYGRVSISFPNNQLYFNYKLKNQVFKISSSKLINNYFKGQLFGDLIFFPYSVFDLRLDISLLKFQNILNNNFAKNVKLFTQLIPIDKKINGLVNIKIDKILSSSNIINSGNIKVEFKNGVLLFKEMKLSMNKIGEIIVVGKILKQKKNKLFNFDAKINIDNDKNFYSRFLIPEKKRIKLKPINLVGQVDLESYKITLKEVLYNKKISQNEVLNLGELINEILSKNSLSNVLKYSNFRKIIQSFFE